MNAGATHRAWRLAIVCLALLVGCSGKSDKVSGEQKDPEKEAKEEPRRLYTGSGEATVRDPEGNRPIRYVLRWDKTQLDYTLEGGALDGAVDKVSGEIYRDGKIGCRFTADLATVDKAKKLLVLSGKVTAIGIDTEAKPENVIATGIDPKNSKLECERLEWRTDKKLMKATGKVTITLEQGVVGPVDELWCLPDLEKAGTPGLLPE